MRGHVKAARGGGAHFRPLGPLRQWSGRSLNTSRVSQCHIRVYLSFLLFIPLFFFTSPVVSGGGRPKLVIARVFFFILTPVRPPQMTFADLPHTHTVTGLEKGRVNVLVDCTPTPLGWDSNPGPQVRRERR